MKKGAKMDDHIRLDLQIGVKPGEIAAANKRLLEYVKRGKEVDPKKVAQDFESFMVFTILKELDKSISMGKKGYAENTYMAIVYEKLGDFISRKGIGIKEMLLKHMEEKKTKVSGKNGDNIVE